MKKIVLLLSLIVGSYNVNAQFSNIIVSDFFGANNYLRIETSPFSWSSLAQPCTYGDAAVGMASDTVSEVLYEIIAVNESHTNIHFFRNDFTNHEDVVSYPGLTMYSLAYNHSTNLLYTVGMPSNTVGATQTLYTIDVTTGTLTSVGDLGITGRANNFNDPDAAYATVIGMTYDPIDDVLLASTANSNLYSINPLTGAETLIGAAPAKLHGMAWDFEEGKLYAGNDGPGNFREINKNTGALISTLGSSDGRMGMAYAPWAFGTGSALTCGAVSAGTGTVCNETTHSFSVTECGSYTVPSGNETYTTSGIRNDTIPNIGGCDSVMTIDITIVNADNTTSTSGVTISSNETDAGVTYQWLNCIDGMFDPVVGATSVDYTPTSNGSYSVIVNDAGCIDTSDCVDVTTLSLSDNGDKAFRLFPNPSNGDITLDLTGLSGPQQLNVVAINGAIVQTNMLNGGTQQSMSLNLDAGLYFLILIDSDGIIRRSRLIIE